MNKKYKTLDQKISKLEKVTSKLKGSLKEYYFDGFSKCATPDCEGAIHGFKDSKNTEKYCPKCKKEKGLDKELEESSSVDEYKRSVDKMSKEDLANEVARQATETNKPQSTQSSTAKQENEAKTKYARDSFVKKYGKDNDAKTAEVEAKAGLHEQTELTEKVSPEKALKVLNKINKTVNKIRGLSALKSLMHDYSSMCSSLELECNTEEVMSDFIKSSKALVDALDKDTEVIKAVVPEEEEVEEVENDFDEDDNDDSLDLDDRGSRFHMGKRTPKFEKVDVIVTFDNGDVIKTGINTDLEGAKKYYLGKTFNVGRGENDLMAKAIKVELNESHFGHEPHENEAVGYMYNGKVFCMDCGHEFMWDEAVEKDEVIHAFEHTPELKCVECNSVLETNSDDNYESEESSYEDEFEDFEVSHARERARDLSMSSIMDEKTIKDKESEEATTSKETMSRGKKPIKKVKKEGFIKKQPEGLSEDEVMKQLQELTEQSMIPISNNDTFFEVKIRVEKTVNTSMKNDILESLSAMATDMEINSDLKENLNNVYSFYVEDEASAIALEKGIEIHFKEEILSKKISLC